MSENQKELRAERLAIMTIDGKVSEATALKFINSQPELYGIENRQEQQEGLGFAHDYQYR